MSGWAADFQFDIGDIVYYRGGRSDGYVVCERVATECTAGVQFSYNITGYAGGRPVPEIALTREPPKSEWQRFTETAKEKTHE